MPIRGYVLVETGVGQTRAVAEAIRGKQSRNASITGVDTVTGPFDVIVTLEAEDLNRLGKAITEEIATVAGVSRTTTCLSVDLS